LDQQSNKFSIGPSNGGDLIRKRAAFIQHSLPGLKPGRYQIQVQQTLLESADNGGKDISGGLPSLTRKLGVAAPRFAVTQNAIHSVFPPVNSAGEFSNVLPHVVLVNEKLPWLRSPYSPRSLPKEQVRAYRAVIDGKDQTIDYDDDQASWLGVLLVSPSEIGHDDPERMVIQGTVRDLLPSGLSMINTPGPLSGTLPANGYSVFSYLLEPAYAADAAEAIDPGIGQSVNDAVEYLDLPAPLFNALCPSLDDLKMMAHVRAVQMEHKPIPSDQTVEPEQRCALVIGNRLPESLQDSKSSDTNPPAGANLALLVSLENMEFALRGHTPGSHYDSAIAARSDGFVRIVVLYRWRFTSWLETSFEFETLLKSLNGRDPKSANNAAPVPDPLLRLPSPPVFPGGHDGEAIIQDMFASGYLPFNHQCRIPLQKNDSNPITTVSWYRGPLIPFGAFVPLIDFVRDDDPALARPAFYSADQLLRFDPNVGIYDVSLAVAWQLGRLLALHDSDFATALYRWKGKVSMQYRAALERGTLTRWYNMLLPSVTAAGPAQIQSVGTDLLSALLRRLGTPASR
jgi:hypothetical protein